MAARTFKIDTTDLSVIITALEEYKNKHPTVSNMERIIKKCKNQMKTIKVSSRKGKGRELQYFICREISELTGIPYIQSDDDCDIHSREMGQHGKDIILRGEALRKFPFSVEAKCSESFDMLGTYEQAITNTTKDTDWLIVHRRKSIPEVIVMLSWNTFKKILKERK